MSDTGLTVLAWTKLAREGERSLAERVGVFQPTSRNTNKKGIPFTQPPVGDLRWKEPQPPKDWTGVRKADQFGPRCAQRPVFGVRRGVRTLK